MDFTNRVALVTGGGAGIGLELARSLVAAGAQVIVCGRDAARLAAAQAMLPELQTIRCDLADRGDTERLAAEIQRRHDHLDLLIHNAAIQQAIDFTGRPGAEAAALAEREIAINLTAPIRLTAWLLPLLQRAGDARIVHIGSALGIAPKRSAPVYGAAKAALRNFGIALDYQLADAGGAVKVQHVLLPLVKTAMTAGRGKGKISAATAARGILEGITAGTTEIRVGKAKLLPWLARIAPNLLAQLMRDN